MFDPILLILIASLIGSILAFFLARKISAGNMNVVIKFSKPQPPRMWTGSSSADKFDDKGKLELEKNEISFRGNKNNFNFSKDSIKEINSLKSQSPWDIVIMLNVLAILGIIYFVTQNSPIFIIIVLCLIVLDGMILVMGTGTEWIEIKYNDKNGVKNIYIGQKAGKLFPHFMGVWGGNSYLYKRMKSIQK